MTDFHSFYQAENYQVESSIGYLVKQLAQTVGKELDRRMVDLGLTDAQWKPLLLLQQGGCTTAVDLSRISCHDAGSITRLLDRLEAKGLVQRVRSAEDRRVVNLELTEEGKKVAAQVPEIIVGLGNEVLKGFSRDEFEQFTNLLTRALANARAVSEGDPTCA
jgi:DNA-binding MarR family transcriptional regulator